MAKKTKPSRTKNKAKTFGKCCENHRDVDCGYKEEENKYYCRKGYDLFGVKCVDFGMVFDEKEIINNVVPNVSQSLYIRIGRIKNNCTHDFCYTRFKGKAVANKGSSRTRRSRKNATK